MKGTLPTLYLAFSATLFFVSGVALRALHQNLPATDHRQLLLAQSENAPDSTNGDYQVPPEAGFDPAQAIDEAEAQSQEKEPPEVDLKIIGSNRIEFSYGKSFFLGDEDRLGYEDRPTSSAIDQGLSPTMDMKMNMQGRIGDEILVNINFDQTENLSNNEVEVIYESAEEDAFLQEMRFGNITADFGRSELYVHEKTDLEMIGIKTRLRASDKVQIKTLTGFSQSLHETEIFRGNSTRHKLIVKEYRYAARQYYQLEPFLYYDHFIAAPSSIPAQAYIRGDAGAFTLFTSQEQNQAPSQVQIDPGSVTVYIDDRNPRNDNALGAIRKRVNGNDLGNFHKLSEGRDFQVHYASGRITFRQPLPVESRVFVQYTRNGGANTTDPTARITNGKIETFLRYGKEMHEDYRRDGVAAFTGSDDMEIIPDGVVNLDIYEVRGIYDLGVIDILEKDFRLQLYTTELSLLEQAGGLGSYTVHYEKGIIVFNSREPFRNLQNEGSYFLSENLLNSVYAETQSSYIDDNSKVRFQLELTAIVRSFQLKYFNIVKESELVRINDVPLSPDYYFIDYQSGYFRFIDPYYPVIGPGTQVQVSYEYLPFGLNEQSYLLGVRGEYRPFDFATWGVRTVYQGKFQDQVSPFLGNEPDSRLIAGTDLEIKIDENRATAMANEIAGGRFTHVPVRLEAYAEYAHSFYNANTTGLAIVDNMETSEEALDISMQASDWVLSALPASLAAGGTGACSRAPLYYRHYYNPDNPLSGLYGDETAPFDSPPYVQVAGPYNIGEAPETTREFDQRAAVRELSLALDFDFAKAPSATAPFVAVNTQELSQNGLDLSGFTYLEFSAKLDNAGSLPAGVEIQFELGSLAEDTDSDGYLDTEDTGLDLHGGDLNSNNIIDAGEHWDEGEKNGRIDRDRNSGNSEDRGYAFNVDLCPELNTHVGAGPDIAGLTSTKGNGALNSEDFNGSGALENNENVVIIHPSEAFASYDSAKLNRIDSKKWTHYRIYLNYNSMNQNQKRVIRSVENMRIVAVPGVGGESGKGRLLIHGLRLAGSLWKDSQAKLAANPAETPMTDFSALRLTMINNFNNPDEYSSESFFTQRQNEYERLYGERTTEELLNTQEGTVKLEYDMDSTYQYVFAKRSFTEPVDIKYYKNIHIWVKNKALPTNAASFLFRVGSGENDYRQYEAPIAGSSWQRVTFRLDNPAVSKGRPLMDNIRYMAIGVKRENSLSQNVTGIIWVNDIYVSDVTIKSDHAYLYEASVDITEPMLITASGVPVLSNTSFYYRKKYKGADYQPIGFNEKGTRLEEEQWYTESDIFPFWGASYGYTQVRKDFIEAGLPGKRTESIHSTSHRMFHNKEFAPHIDIGYQNTDTRETQKHYLESIVETEQKNTVLEKTRTPNVIVTETLPAFFNTNVNYTLESSMEFFEREQTTSLRSGGVLSSETLKREKDQTEHGKAALHINYKGLHIEPEHEYSRSLLLDKNYIDQSNLTLPQSDFFIPGIAATPDFRFRSRSAGYRFRLSHDQIWAFSPQVAMSLLFREESFRDNEFTYRRESYQRLRNPATTGKINVDIPLFFYRFLESNLIESANFSYTREIILEENGLPFTSKTSLYDDSLALNRTYPGISDKTYNLFQYPFWHFFQSDRQRHNFSNGREFVQTTSYDVNRGDIPEEALLAYDNALTLSEWGALTTFWNPTDSWRLRTLARISQNARRESIGGLPNQEVNVGSSLIQTFDLMKILSFSFWEKPSNSSTFNLDFHIDRFMFITQNRVEESARPETGISFEWMNRKRVLTNISFLASFGFTHIYYYSFIEELGPPNDRLIYENMNFPSGGKLNFDNVDYFFALEFSTELPRLKAWGQNLTKLYLKYNPFYLVQLSADLHNIDFNTYDYQPGVIYDQYILDQRIDMNLHANVTGLLGVKMVYDVEKNPISKIPSKKVFSYQAGIGANILF